MLFVNSPVAVHGLEIVGQRAHVLARAEEQDAVPLEREVQQAEHALLCERLQVNQHVPAAHQVEPGEGRVLHHVVGREHHQLPKLGHDLKIRSALVEIALEQGRLDACNALGVVEAAAREIERAAVHVGRENLDASAVAALVQLLLQQDRDRVRLFPGGAAGDPDPHLVTRRLLRE
jgi:hypothetical protein